MKTEYRIYQDAVTWYCEEWQTLGDKSEMSYATSAPSLSKLIAKVFVPVVVGK